MNKHSLALVCFVIGLLGGGGDSGWTIGSGVVFVVVLIADAAVARIVENAVRSREQPTR